LTTSNDKAVGQEVETGLRVQQADLDIEHSCIIRLLSGQKKVIM
jgi:hypothetical protein